MNKIFLDTEFNGFGGQLISMALVGPNDSEWYEVLHLPTQIDPWVSDHVVPYLNKHPIEESEFKRSLISFLQYHAGVPIVADWPEDFMHLMKFLYGPNGEQLNLEFKFELVISGTLNPEIPHNALHDARALKQWYKNEH